MIQRRAEEVFPGQRLRPGARTCLPRHAETGRTGAAARPEAIGFRWLLAAAEMAGLAAAEMAGLAAANRRPRLPRVATRTIGADTGSVRAAREFAVATLRRWGTAERGYDDIAIVVSELLTNALRHGLPGAGDIWPRWPIRLGLLQHGSGVLCAVADPGRAVPVPQAPGCLAETGRGLQMIRALSDRWGYTTPDEAGKIVWAMLEVLLQPMQHSAVSGKPWNSP
jgi:anti-sigma regulatory factor (Ser/Thr protein kinase)